MNNRFAFLPMVDSNDLLDDPEALRARLDRDSYLLFRRVLDPDTVRGVRRAMLGVTASLGWTEPISFPASQRCIVPPLREEDPEFIEGYQQIQRLQPFHELAHDPALLHVMRQVLGETAFPHPLKIARIAFPDHYEASTPPHQDYPNNQGTEHLTAAWIPVTDIPAQLGGLAVLRGSHRWGLLPLETHIGAGNRCAVVPPDMAEACHWVTTEFALGDVLLFPSLAVHASLHNASEFYLRLSVDFRYQLEGEALTPGCLKPHFGLLDWEDVYRDWNGGHQYYWKDLDYEVVPFEDLRPVNASAGSELSQDDLAAILQYETRVQERVKRRMEALGREIVQRDSIASTMNRPNNMLAPRDEDPAPG